jgi:hypothetical protein
MMAQLPRHGVELLCIAAALFRIHSPTVILFERTILGVAVCPALGREFGFSMKRHDALRLQLTCVFRFNNSWALNEPRPAQGVADALAL